ncbi:MAG: IgGFc-binding protein [Myxococcota bacterium]
MKHRTTCSPARIDYTLYICAMVSMVLGFATACQDDAPPQRGIAGGSFSTGTQDAEFRDDTGSRDQPVRSLCTPGSKRCLFENSPIFEVCGEDGQRVTTDVCAEGQKCQDGRCVEFSCTPGHSICLSTTTTADCAPDGRSFVGIEECERAGEVCTRGECVDPCETAREQNSYIGCEYISRELPNFYRFQGPPAQNAPFAIIAANPHPVLGASVTIEDVAGNPVDLIERITVVPSDAYENAEPETVASTIIETAGSSSLASPARDVRVPPKSAAVFLIDVANLRQQETYRVRSTRPVVAYQFSPYCCNFTATNDASLLLPTYTLGKRYRVLTYPALYVAEQQQQLPSYFSVVAEQDATSVTINSSLALAYFLNDERVEQPGDQIMLDAGDALRLETEVSAIAADGKNADPTGVEVVTNKPSAVFSGHFCTYVPQDQQACDHLEEQLLPATTLGKDYILTPVRRRISADQPNNEERVYWRVVADEPSEVIFEPPLHELRVSPPSNPYTSDCRDRISDGKLSLDEGEFCEFGVLEAVSASSTGALSIGGVISGHQSTGIPYYGSQAGDPGFFLLPPVKQFRQNYSFVAPPTFEKTYVAVAIREGSSVALDGAAVPPDSRLGRRSVELGGEEWEVFSVRISAGFHTMDSSRKFGIVAYAFDDYVSYAFPGGLDLVPKGATE